MLNLPGWIPCPRCARHARASDEVCTFCGEPIPTPQGLEPLAFAAVVAAVASAAVLASCAGGGAVYGPAPMPASSGPERTAAPADSATSTTAPEPRPVPAYGAPPVDSIGTSGAYGPAPR